MDLKKLYRLSLLCALLPMTIGAAVFLMWYFTRSALLMVVGIFTIYLGIVCVITGLASLIIYGRKCLREGRKSYAKKGVLPLTVLLLNFPLAVLIVSASINLMAQYRLTVVNETDFDVSNISFVGPGVDVATGPVKSQESSTVIMRFKHDGVLRYHISFNKVEVDGDVKGYVTRNMGGEKLFIIREEGIEIKSRE
jgi:hypothetical protein